MNNYVAWDRTGTGLTMDVLDEMFAQHERDYGDMVMVYGMYFHPIDIVKELDPAAYRVLRGDWLSERVEDEYLFDTQEEAEEWIRRQE